MKLTIDIINSFNKYSYKDKEILTYFVTKLNEIILSPKGRVLSLCQIATMDENYSVLEWLISQGEILENCTDIACKKNNLKLVKWIQLKNHVDDLYTRSKCCEYAVENNNFEMLLWLRSQYNQNNENEYPWDENCFIKAIENNNLEMIKLLLFRNPPCPWDESCCLEAVEYKNLNLLIWLRSQEPPCPWDERCFSQIVHNKDETMFKWILGENAPYEKNVKSLLRSIEMKDNLETLKWLKSQNLVGLNLSWDDCFSYACERNSLEMAKWIRNQSFFMADYKDSKYCEMASENNNLDFLRWLRDGHAKVNNSRSYIHEVKNSFVQSVKCCENACENNNLEMLRFIKGDKGMLFTSKKCFEYAVRNNNIEMLEDLRLSDDSSKYPIDIRRPHLYNVECKWDATSTSAAIETKNLKIFNWLRAQNPPCPVDENCCYFAVKNGDYETLKYLRNLNLLCPWDERCCEVACKNNDLEMLKYLRSQNPPCPWSAKCYIMYDDDEDIEEDWHYLHNEKSLINEDEDNESLDLNQEDSTLCITKDRLKILTYLQKGESKPCPWDEKCCETFIEYQYIDLLKWSLTQDYSCPISERCFEICISDNDFNLENRLIFLNILKSQKLSYLWDKEKFLKICRNQKYKGCELIEKWILEQKD
jgi:hypothetical protein